MADTHYKRRRSGVIFRMVAPHAAPDVIVERDTLPKVQQDGP